MKTLLVPACCAAALASAGELKEPSDVAQYWSDTVAEARQPTVAPNLAGQTVLNLKSPKQSFDFGFGKPRIYHHIKGSPLYDAPNHRQPRAPSHDRPRGAKPWEYNGEIYWIVPLTPAKNI